MPRIFFWLTLVFLVIFRFFTTQPHYTEGQKIRITAKVSGEPIKYSFKQKLNLLGLKIYLPLYPEIGYGDKVVVEGTVLKGELKDARLVGLVESQGILYRLRSKIVDFYQRSLPEPHASLVAGIVLGSKSQIPGDFWEALQKTGTLHVVVASGMNVSIIAGFLVAFLAIFLPRKKALPVAITGIWVYALLSGFEAPIVRAAIMGSLAFTAQGLGKLSGAWPILFLTALIMLIIKPQWLTDLGFILSFVATASIILFQPRLDKFFKSVPKLIREDFSTTLAAQIGVSPILFVTFGQFNILSPVINILILWTVPLIMIIGGVGGVIGLLIPALGRLILYLGYPLNWWFVTIIRGL